MPDCSDAQLIGFLLNALQDEEREQLAAELSRRPELRRRLRQLRDLFWLLEESREDFSPPPDLLRRTCALVAQERLQTEVARAYVVSCGTSRTAPSWSGFRWAPLSDHWAADQPRWSILDLTVACMVVTLLFAILLPALAEMRFQYQVAICRDNLQRFYLNLAKHRDLHPDFDLSKRDPQDVRFAALLALTGSAERLFLPCPGSRLRTLQASLADSDGFSEPDWAGYAPLTKTAAVYPQTLFTAGLSEPSPAADLLSEATLICRDARVFDGCNVRSWNHSGRGENWLFADGHVRFVPQQAIPGWATDSARLVSFQSP